MRKGRENFLFDSEIGSAIKVYVVAKPQDNESSISMTYSFNFGYLYSTTMNNLFTMDKLNIYMNKTEATIDLQIEDADSQLIIWNVDIHTYVNLKEIGFIWGPKNGSQTKFAKYTDSQIYEFSHQEDNISPGEYQVQAYVITSTGHTYYSDTKEFESRQINIINPPIDL